MEPVEVDVDNYQGNTVRAISGLGPLEEFDPTAANKVFSINKNKVEKTMTARTKVETLQEL